LSSKSLHTRGAASIEKVGQRRARSNMDEDAAGPARVSNVRVVNELIASAAASWPVESAGRRIPNATPRVIGGRSKPGKPLLMQRQPWVAGWEPARNLSALDEKELEDLQQGADISC
jgi:hypothetical protein